MMTSMNRSQHASLAALVLCMSSGCTSSDSIPRISGAPSLPSDVSSLRYESDYTLSGLTTIGDGMIVASDEAALWLNDSSLSPLLVRADTGEAAATGAVHSVTARAYDVLISSDQGLYETYDEQLLRSPLNEDLSEPSFRTLHSTGQGSQEQLWAATANRVYRIADGSLTQWTLDSLQGEIVSIGFTGSIALIATSEALYELDPTLADLTPIEADLGTVYGLSVGNDGEAYVASDAGLVSRTSDGEYRIYTLSDDEHAEPVTAVHVDTSVGVIAATNSGLITLDEQNSSPVGLAAFEGSQQVSALNADDDGYAWLTHGQSLQGWLVGTATSFHQDVSPMLEAQCTRCHDEGGTGPTFDLRDYDIVQARASDIMTRLDAQQMPPDESLDNSDYEIFRRWYRSGQNP